jgi:predicted RecB family nuclease
MRVHFAGLMAKVQSAVRQLTTLQHSANPPPLILNRHCAECEFQARCREIAAEKDDLSLLSTMTGPERRKHNSARIFTVTQLSYTFRPRRKPPKLANKPEKFHNSLKALAMRENKIHVIGQPELKITGSPVYLDVEGTPDSDFYYLIGLRGKGGEEYVQFSFWANDISEERNIWKAFLYTLLSLDNPQIIHYGSYETTFLKRMNERHGGIDGSGDGVDKLLREPVNILPLLYSQIYFPTYSNGLK